MATPTYIGSGEQKFFDRQTQWVLVCDLFDIKSAVIISFYVSFSLSLRSVTDISATGCGPICRSAWKFARLVQLLPYFDEKAAVRTGLVAKSITSPEMFRYRCSQYMRIIFLLYVLVSCAWWDWSSTWLTESNRCSSVPWRCWLGHLTRKIVLAIVSK